MVSRVVSIVNGRGIGTPVCQGCQKLRSFDRHPPWPSHHVTHLSTALILFAVANALASIVVVALVHAMRGQQKTVREYAMRIAGSCTDPADIARRLAREIHGSIRRLDDDPPFLHRALRPIGASPHDVLRYGACCSGISRLYILALDSIGIEAAQVTLCHRSGVARHCLVEVAIGGDPQIIDPTYGLSFELPAGGHASLADLRGGVRPLLVSLADGSASSYPGNEYYAFDFSATKTANWTSSWPRRIAYAVLSIVVDIDGLRVPALFEWPHAIVASGLMVGALGLDLFAWVR